MNVLMTADTIGGVWTYAVELGRWLVARGAVVSVATMGDYPTDAQRAEAAAAGVQLFESGFRLEWMDDPWEDVEHAARWLVDLERRLAPDVVHLNGYAHASLPWRAPTLVVAHSCVTSWWVAVHGEAPPARYDRYRRAVAEGIAAASTVVAPTRAMLTAVVRHYRSPRRARVIANGIDPSRFAPSDKEEVVLSAGRAWDAAKNVAALACAAPRVAWPVCVAGSLEPRARADAELESVHLLGRLPPAALAHWMSRASIYALPALYEPFGLSLVEAALSGCALVVGDIPSLRETWSNAAVFVDPRDVDALAWAIEHMIEDRAFRAKMAEAAMSRAHSYGIDRSGAQYLALYRELATGSAHAQETRA